MNIRIYKIDKEDVSYCKFSLKSHFEQREEEIEDSIWSYRERQPLI